MKKNLKFKILSSLLIVASTATIILPIVSCSQPQDTTYDIKISDLEYADSENYNGISIKGLTEEAFNRIINEDFHPNFDNIILTIPDKIDGKDVVEIGENSFNLLPITKIDFSNAINLKLISPSAFAFCCHVENEIIFPPNLIEIDPNAFEGCIHIPTIIFNDKLEQIGNDAFYFCHSLHGELRFPNSIGYIGDSSFYGTAYNSLIIPDGLGSISANCFGSMVNLKNIEFGKNIKKVNASAFKNCHNIEQLNFNSDEFFPYFYNTSLSHTDNSGRNIQINAKNTQKMCDQTGSVTTNNVSNDNISQIITGAGHVGDLKINIK